MNFLKFLRSEKGFTLIELLVVIGVLGILATGLLATIDPLEQFRKGADSNRKTTALELVNALTRYYSVHGTFPWRPTAEGGPATPCNGGGDPSGQQVTTANGTTPFNDCLTILTNEGELKTTFQTQFGILSKLFVTDTTPQGSTARNASVCFDPESKSEGLKPETQFTVTATVNANCPAAGVACYWCSQ